LWVTREDDKNAGDPRVLAGSLRVWFPKDPESNFRRRAANGDFAKGRDTKRRRFGDLEEMGLDEKQKLNCALYVKIFEDEALKLRCLPATAALGRGASKPN
jgi:hypothetical protein